jgi:hypothetical protein
MPAGLNVRRLIGVIKSLLIANRGLEILPGTGRWQRGALTEGSVGL